MSLFSQCFVISLQIDAVQQRYDEACDEIAQTVSTLQTTVSEDNTLYI